MNTTPHSPLYPTPEFTILLYVSMTVLLLLLSRFSRVHLCVTPETAAHQAPPSRGFSRQEHWSGLPFPPPMHESEKWKWSRSVMSDSSRPHGQQPTRLLRPRDFPGKSTGVGCHWLWLLYKLRISEVLKHILHSAFILLWLVLVTQYNILKVFMHVIACVRISFHFQAG